MWPFKGVPLTGFLTEIKKIWWVPILYLGEPQTTCLCIKFEKKCKIDPPYRTQQTAGTHSPPVPPPPSSKDCLLPHKYFLESGLKGLAGGIRLDFFFRSTMYK